MAGTSDITVAKPPRSGRGQTWAPYRQRRLAMPVRDGRTLEARLLRQTVAELRAYLGGAPDVRQVLLIEEIARQTLLLAEMDAEAAQGRPPDPETYLAASNGRARLLVRLGPPGRPNLSLGAHIRSLAVDDA
jgi:hypothetical protein